MAITKNIINEMKTQVTQDGRHLYYEVGPDLNILDDKGDLIATNLAISLPDVGDVCDVKTSGTKFKCGYSAVDLGIKDRISGKTYIVEPYQVVGLIIDKLTTRYEVIETANTTGKTLSADNSVTLFKYCTLKYEPINSGVAVKHFYSKSLAKDYPQYKHYGMLWKCADKDILTVIESDKYGAHPTEMYKTDDGFIEYFSAEEFHDQNPETGICDGALHDVEHNYSTVGGTLGANTEWTAGTYYVTSAVNTGAYTLTLNCAAGNIIIKPTTGAETFVAINVSAAGGKLLTSNTGTYKVIVTSMNDDSVGEEIAGSSGSPATGDVRGRVFGLNDNTTEMTLDNVEIWYSQGSIGIIVYSLNGDQSAAVMALSHIKFKYCTINNTYNYTKAYIGQYRYTTATGTFNLSNIEIDSTNNLEHDTYASCVRVGTNGSASFALSQSYFEPTNTASLGVIYGYFPNGTTIKSVYVKYSPAANDRPCVYIRNIASTSPSYTVENVVADCVDKSSGYTSQPFMFYGSTAGQTITITMRNCSAMNSPDATGAISFAGAGSFAGTFTHNNFYNNTAAFDTGHGVTNDNPITADPQLSTAPAGSTILATSPFSGKSVVVTNLTDLEKKGSDTFDNLSWDEAVYSATGYGYAGTDKVTPGLMIEWSAFATDGIVPIIINHLRRLRA